MLTIQYIYLCALLPPSTSTLKYYKFLIRQVWIDVSKARKKKEENPGKYRELLKGTLDEVLAHGIRVGKKGPHDSSYTVAV